MVRAMAYRPIVDTVPKVDGPPADVAGVEERLVALRGRFPGAIIERYLALCPSVAEGVHIASGAAVVGDVVLHGHVSIWYGCVLRADIARIEIRERSNLQDGTVVHLADDHGTFVAEEVTVGHRAVLHACRVGAGSLVGIQASVLDGAVIGEGCVIGAGAVVRPGAEIPARSLVLGVPGKVVKTLTAQDEDVHRKMAAKYTRLAHNYRVG